MQKLFEDYFTKVQPLALSARLDIISSLITHVFKESVLSGKVLHHQIFEGLIKRDDRFELTLKGVLERCGATLFVAGQSEGLQSFYYTISGGLFWYSFGVDPYNDTDNVVEGGDWYSFGVATSDRGHYEAIFRGFKELFITRNESDRAYVVIQDDNQLRLRSIGMAHEDLCKENYSTTVVKEVNHVKTDIGKNDPCGRFVLLNGPPGTGKTYIVRHLIGCVKPALFIILPSSMIASISDPSFMQLLIMERSRSNKGPMVIILEDADNCLLPRGSDNMSGLSILFNMTDGIMGKALDLRLIATTNAKKVELEPALLRPGRLCRRIEVPELDVAQANQIYARLQGSSGVVKFHKPVTLAEVYGAAHG